MKIRLACSEAAKRRVAVRYLLALTTAYWLLLIVGLFRSDLALLPGTHWWALPDAQHTALQLDEAYWAWPSRTADFAGRGGLDSKPAPATLRRVSITVPHSLAERPVGVPFSFAGGFRGTREAQRCG